MNKERLIALLMILIKYADSKHPLSSEKLIDILYNEYQIPDCNRKTIYDDIAVLDKMGFAVIRNKYGYCLKEEFLSLAEVKILIDALNSLKNISTFDLSDIKKKLFKTISLESQRNLENFDDPLILHDQDNHFMNNMELAIRAISQNKLLLMTSKRKKDYIKPYYLYRMNDYYYLFYTYLTNDHLFRIRFDRIKELIISDDDFIPSLSKDDILANIAASTQMFYGTKAVKVELMIIDEGNNIYERLQDDFSNVIINQKKKRAYLKASVNDVFLAKLCAYKNQIKILTEEVALAYKDYLGQIINVYRPEK